MNTKQLKQSNRSIGWQFTAVVIVLILTSGLAGCFVQVGRIRATDTISDSFVTSSQPTVIVETFNGKITVQAGSDNQVAVNVTKIGSGSSQSEAEADLENVEVTFSQSGDTIRVIARRMGSRLVNNSGAEIELTVPEAAILDLATSNGAITSTGIKGDLDLSTSNGKLVVSGGQGMLELRTSNGSIEVEAQLASVRAHTSNGAIDFTGSLADGDHVFETSNGSVDISLPADSQFRIDARTSNGRVSTDFRVDTSRTSRENELFGIVGEDPSISITAESSNGAIRLTHTR